MELKCKKCGKIKPTEKFLKVKGNRSGYLGHCRECANAPRRKKDKPLTKLEYLTQQVLFHGPTLDECLLWEHGKMPFGYPSISIKDKQYQGSRIAYEIIYGEIPDGLFVRHKCDTPACYNPAHLETGTCKENSEDMVKRGRARKGRLISAFGEEKTIAEWVDDPRCSISLAALYNRVYSGWEHEYAISSRPQRTGTRGKAT